jgi:hypothetical protein
MLPPIRSHSSLQWLATEKSQVALDSGEKLFWSTVILMTDLFLY